MRVAVIVCRRFDMESLVTALIEIRQDLVAGSVWHRTAIAKSLAFL